MKFKEIEAVNDVSALQKELDKLSVPSITDAGYELADKSDADLKEELEMALELPNTVKRAKLAAKDGGDDAENQILGEEDYDPSSPTLAALKDANSDEFNDYLDRIHRVRAIKARMKALANQPAPAQVTSMPTKPTKPTGPQNQGLHLVV